MVEITTHVPHKSSIDNFTPFIVLSQSKHIAAKIFKLLLPDISNSLTYDLPYILSYYCIFSTSFIGKQTKSVNFRRGYIDLIGGIFDQNLFLFGVVDCSRKTIFKIFLDIFKCDKRNDFRFDHLFFIDLVHFSFFEVIYLFFGYVVPVDIFISVFLFFDVECTLSLPVETVVYLSNSFFSSFSVALVQGEGLQVKGKMIGFIESIIYKTET